MPMTSKINCTEIYNRRVNKMVAHHHHYRFQPNAMNYTTIAIAVLFIMIGLTWLSRKIYVRFRYHYAQRSSF